MKIERVIQLAGMMERGNVLPEELAIAFLSEFDGMIQSDIMLHAPEEIVRYDSVQQELLLRPPHDQIYVSYLVAMIRQSQGEYEGYNNAQAIVEDKLKTFRRWYIHHYRPADTDSRSYTGGTSGGAFGFAYLSAYGIAVKRGYQGSEEEWLQSLKGAKGDAGAAARMRYDAERDMVQWGVGDEWHDLYTMAEVLAPLYEKLDEMVGRAETAAANAEKAATEAKGAAAAAGTQSGQATKARNEAVAAQGAAEQAAQQAAGHSNTALENARKAGAAAEDAATLAETAGNYAQMAEEAAQEAKDAAASGGGSVPGSGASVETDTTLTQSGKAADAKATGDEIKRVEGKIPSLEGYAKSDEIPTKPEDIGAQPQGDYLTEAPVTTVNGKTGAVVLGAGDVGARPDTWVPTAQEVGALPNTYVPPTPTADQVGADSKGTAVGAVSAHNTDTDAHNDLRLAVQKLQAAVDAFLDVDDTTRDELSEVLALIDANADVIEAITTSKVSVSDIINNLTTNVANKPLSAAQGVAIKALIDGLSASLANYQPKGNYALESAVPTKVSQLDNDSKFISAVTAAMVTAALGYTPINPTKATLGRHTDGLLYLFVDSKPVGTGVELPTGGIDGYITEDKQIIFSNLPDGEYTLAYLMEDGTIVTIGEMEKDTNTYYSVTHALTNCTSSNSTTRIVEGGNYEATITANAGYELSSVKVTMGGVDISSTVVSGGTIIIPAVTGDVVITAAATEVQTGPAYTNQIPISTDASGNPFNGGQGWKTGYRLSLSGGGETAANGYECTGFIPARQNDVISIKDIDLTSESATNVVCYDSNKQPYNAGSGQYGVTLYGLFVNNGSNDGGVYTATLGGGVANCFGPGLAYIRIGSKSITAESIVTVNQDIL